MAKRRYVAPARDSLAPGVFAHPMFDAVAAHRDLLLAPDWPALATLDARLAARAPDYRFVAQDEALLADGLHYESRIAAHGAIATRSGNWHDLLNALIWIEYPAIKRALNRRQVEEIDRVGPAQRSRAQCALTHFDEAGVIVVLRDRALLALWDAHDWHGLFWRQRDAWTDGRAELVVFGHALLEHALTPRQLITAKALVVRMREDLSADALATVADAIARGGTLDDPQCLRPLPLSGVPGWHPDNASECFYRSADCFRPLRPGRLYPAPLLPRAA